MWFFVAAIIVVVLFGLWFRRTNLYRARRGGHSVKPGQAGFDAGGWHDGKYGD